jgi:hypothetical protein
MTNKTTKREHFTNIANFLRENGKDEWVAVMEHEIDLLNRKNTKSGEKKVNEKMETAKATVMEFLATVDKATVQEVKAVLNSENTQFPTSVLTRLVKDGQAKREVIKGKSHYSLA